MPVLKRRRGKTSAASSGPGYKQVSHYDNHKGQNERHDGANGNIHQDIANIRRTLVIPPPSHEVAAALHDEMDTFSFKNPALTKFKLSNELLENVISKLIPLHTVIPPESFPKVIFDGAITDTSKLSNEELIEKVKNAKPSDVLFGDIETLKVKLELVKQKTDKLSQQSDALLENLVDSKYKFEVEKSAALKKLFHTYNAKDLKKYEEEVSTIGKQLMEDFKKQIKEEDEIVKFSQPELLKAAKVTCTFEQLKEKKKLDRSKLEEMERIKREEENRKAEELRKREEEGEKKRQEELAEKQKNEQERLQQQQQQQQQAQQAAQQYQITQQPLPQAPQPVQVPVGDTRYYMDPFGPPQGSVPTQAVSQPLSFQMGGNEFGLDNGNVDGLLNGGLYGAGEDLMIDDDAGFGALDDQVFLSNLDGSLD